MPIAPLNPDVIHNIFDILSLPLAVHAGYRSIGGYIDYFPDPGYCFYEETELRAKNYLTACSLVSREWAAMTRPYIFRTMALLFSPDTVPQTLEEIEAWLRESPATAKYIRKLRLRMLDCARTRIDGKGHEDYCCLGTLSTIIEHCSSLQALELANIQIVSELHRYPEIGASMSTLSSLTIDPSRRLRSVAALLSSFAACPHLRMLNLGLPGWSEATSMPEDSLPLWDIYADIICSLAMSTAPLEHIELVFAEVADKELREVLTLVSPVLTRIDEALVRILGCGLYRCVSVGTPPRGGEGNNMRCYAIA